MQRGAAMHICPTRGSLQRDAKSDRSAIRWFFGVSHCPRVSEIIARSTVAAMGTTMALQVGNR